MESIKSTEVLTKAYTILIDGLVAITKDSTDPLARLVASLALLEVRELLNENKID